MLAMYFAKTSCPIVSATIWADFSLCDSLAGKLKALLENTAESFNPMFCFLLQVRSLWYQEHIKGRSVQLPYSLSNIEA